MTSAVKRTILAIAALSLLAPAMTVQAQFAEHHPRRAQVNRRVRRQGNRINQGVASGRLSPQQAQQLRANDAAIKAQERADVQANGGYLTKRQQRQLNQEQNANSRLIYDEKHPAGQ
jgi:hypothetical protein